MQTWGSRILPGSWSYTNWWWNVHWKENREKESWNRHTGRKRLVACKTDGQCACLTEPCTSSPQSLLLSCKISSWLSLCNPLCSVCVGGAGEVRAAGTRCCQEQCEWMWDQQLESSQRCRLDRRGHVSTLGIHWRLHKSRVCCEYWDSASTRAGGVICASAHVSPCQSCKQVMSKAAPCPWQPVSPSCGCLCTSLLVSTTEQVSCYFLCSLISFYG